MNSKTLDDIRLNILKEYRILDTPEEDFFNNITEIAAQLTNTPIALVTIIDDYRQWFKSNYGLKIKETPREVAFCNHTIEQNDVFIVEDALQDHRFKENPLVTGVPEIRFYAGAAITLKETNIGTLCIIDTEPKKISESEISLLKTLSNTLSSHLETRRAILEMSDHFAKVLVQNNTIEDDFTFATHEIKTPLTVILGNLDLLNEGYYGDFAPDARRTIGVTLEYTRKLISQMSSLLDIQKKRLSISAYNFEIATLSSICISAISNLQGYLPKKNITIKHKLDDDIVIRADQMKLRHAFENILSNAIKFSPENTSVLLSTYKESDLVKITFSDEGNGIDNDLKSYIFDKYTFKSSDSGIPSNGLGLSIAKDIIEAHTGNISFESNENGTTFIIELPGKILS